MNMLESDGLKRMLEPQLRALDTFTSGREDEAPIEDMVLNWEVTAYTAYQDHDEVTYRYNGAEPDEPSWVVRDEGSYFRIEFDYGCYEQMCDAKDFDEAIKVMGAMVEACRVLNEVLGGDE